MKARLKIAFRVVGSVVGAVLLLIVGTLVWSTLVFKPAHAAWPLRPIAADTTPEGIARGEYLAQGILLCAHCHSSDNDTDMAGTAERFEMGPFRGVETSPNLTPHRETGLGEWSDAEIARAVRETVGRDGVELVVMPSAYRALSDADTAAVLGYLRSLAPVDRPLEPLSFNAPTRAALAIGLFGAGGATEPIAGPVAARDDAGAYLVEVGICAVCHGSDLKGGAGPSGGGPEAIDLTSTGPLASMDAAAFTRRWRERAEAAPAGLVPEGAMPWRHYRNVSDGDLAAILRALQALP